MNTIRITLLTVVCLTSITLFFQMITSSILPQNAKKWFGLTFCGIMTAAVAEYFGDMMNGDTAHITLHIIIKLIEFFITPWLPFLMAMACNAVRKPKIVASVLFIHMLAEIALVFSGSIFYISSDGIYHHGPLYFIYGVAFTMAFLYLLAVFVILSQRYRKYHRLNLLLSALILLAGLIPALIDSSCRTAFLGISLSSFVLYTYYEGLTQQQLAEDLEKRNQLINRMQGRIIEGIADLIENRDSNTGTHIKNTSAYVEMLALAAKNKGLYADVIDDHYIDMITRAAPLHDVGKIVVSDSILLKPGKLTSEEFDLIKRHAKEGGRIVDQILGGVTDDEFMRYALEIAVYHHEKWDGSGYPEGLKGEAIPLSARIMALADVYDALIMKRPYKEAFSTEKALGIIEEGLGSHFDPELGKLFVETMRNLNAE